VIISLVPPRNPNSTKADERRWTVIEANGNIARYTQLYGTSVSDPQGAKAEANRVLNHKYAWTVKGRGFQARTRKASR
jgi:hypothetical protein